jgi:MFS family permease
MLENLNMISKAVLVTESEVSDEEKPSTPTDETTEHTYSEPPYHVFSTGKKWQLVGIVSLAGLFSPLSSNIYFPALGAIAAVGVTHSSYIKCPSNGKQETNTDIALVALTVTVYMAVQGVAPSFWGPLSDTRGRRITFIGTFAVYLLANVALAFSDRFEMLMVFRAVQAAGSAATISVGMVFSVLGSLGVIV